MVKGRYYAKKEFLEGAEAASYLQELTGVKLLRDELFSCVGKELNPYVVLFTAPDLYFSGKIRGRSSDHIKAIGAQRLCSHWHLFKGGDEYRFTYCGGLADYVELEGRFACKGFQNKFSVAECNRWELFGRELCSASDLLFKTSEVKLLAAKMNNSIKANSAQKELKILQDEVKRLRVENSSLKADDRLNPRKEEALYRLIIAMATRGYGYNPDAARNSAIADILMDLDSLGVGLGERTVRRHLKAAKAHLPPKSVKK